MKIRTKIFIANMLVVTLLLGVLTNVLVNYVSDILLDKARENIGYSVSQLALNIDNTLKTYEQVIDSFYINNEVQEALLKPYASPWEAQNVYFDTISPYINGVRATTDALQMTIYTHNPTFQFSNVQLINDEVKNSDWYKPAYEAEARLSRNWMYLGRSEVHKADVIRLVGKLYNIFYQAKIFITLDIEQSTLERLIEKENKTQRYIIALSNGQVIIDSKRSTGGNTPQIENYGFYPEIAKQDSASFVYREGGREYLLVSKTIHTRNSVTGMKVISLVPIQEYVSKVNEVKGLAIWLFLIALAFSMLIIYAISSGLTKRLTVLTDKIKSINTDNLHEFIEVKGKDEISQVSRVFNQMMSRMDRLIKQVYESELHRKELELKKRESELYALQTQINPHYLFNTLNAIRGSLLENGDFKNADIVKWFAQSFRNLLSNKNDMVPLRIELESVETYMRVQSFRYGPRLVFSCEVPEQLRDCPIPRLAVHTLIENSLVHGLDKNEETTHISIAGTIMDEHHYRITVADDGPGFPADVRAAVNKRLERQPLLGDDKHFGLCNVHGRIRMTFGDGYGLAIEPNDGRGAAVHMILPTTWTESGGGTDDV